MQGMAEFKTGKTTNRRRKNPLAERTCRLPCHAFLKGMPPARRSVPGAAYVNGAKLRARRHAGGHRLVLMLVVFIAVSVVGDVLCGTFFHCA